MYKKSKFDKNYVIFVLIYILIFIPIIILRFPDIRNEIKYFLITDTIIESKNFFILKYLNELYPDKPPLYFLILYITKKYFGKYFIQGAIFFGTLIPSVLITTFFYKFMKTFKNKRVAFINTVFLLSLPFYIGLSIFMRMDMLMTAFIFFALYLFFRSYYGSLELNKKNIFKIYIFIFLALFTKGIAGIVVPFSIILAFLIFERDLKFLKNIKFIQGVIFIILLIGIWGVLILQQPQGKEYLKLLLGQETIGRITSSKTHIRNFYYYIENIPIIMYPYGVGILISLIFYLKNIKNYENWAPIEKIGFLWSIVPLLLFSCTSGKLAIYLLPIFPGNIIILVNFFMKTKNIKFGKLILRITEIFSIIAIPLNYFLNRRKNFYKRILLIPFSIFIIFVFVVSGIEVYNREFSLKYIVENILKYDNKEIIAYKFSDMINLKNEIKKEILLVENKEDIKLKDKNVQVIVSKNKYIGELEKENFKVIYKNMSYILLVQEGEE